MPADQFLQLRSGAPGLQVRPGVDTSTGVAQAGRLVALDNGGLISRTMLPPWPRVATVAALPATGYPGEVYVVDATGAIYQWNNRRSTWAPWAGPVHVTVAASNAPVEVIARSDFVCTGTNDHLVIQSALALIPNGGTVELSAGEFVVGAAIKLSTRQRVVGAGPGTNISPPTGGVSWLASDGSGRQGAIFEANAQNQEQFGVQSMSLLGRWGGGSNLKGIYFNISQVPPSGGDSELFLHDLLIEDFQDNPVHITGVENRAGKASNIRCFVNNAAFLVESGDWECSMIDVGVSSGHGIHVGAAGNTRWSSCKAFYCALSGFRIQGSRTVLVGCEAQDNTQHGFLIEERVNMSGCSADSNGYNGTNTPTPTFDGVHFLDGAPTQYSRVTVVAQDKNEGGRGLHQRYGIYLSPQTTPIVVSAVCRTNAVAAAGGDLTITPDRSIVIVPGMGHLNSLTRVGLATAAALSADVDNWTIPGFDTAGTVRISSTTAVSVTGLAGGAEGREVVLHNTGANQIFLRANSAASLAANRFTFVGDLEIQGRAAVLLRYDNGGWIQLSSMQDYPAYVYIDANPWKFSVRASANTNVASLSGLQTIDGEALIADDRVLLLGQTAAADNGIWVVGPGGWSRPQDADTGVDMQGMVVYVRRGAARQNTFWVQTDEDANPPTFTQFGQPGGGGGAPAGANTQIQYNNGGAFGAEAALAYDPATDVFTAPTAVTTGAQRLTGVITPAQITADVNDYNPAGLATAAVVRIAGNAANRALTGLAAQANGTTLVLQNVGPVQLALRAESTASTAANRFALTRDIYLLPNNTVAVRYDSTTARWVLIGGPYTRNTIVSVRDFGAVGDGVANDTAAIQAAINSLATTGGMVWFPEGTYAVSAPINVQTNGLLLFGVGVSDMLATAAGSTVSTGRGSIIRAMSTWAGAGATAAMVRFTSTNGDGRPLLGGGMSGLHVCGWRFSTTPPAGTVHGIYARVARGLFDNVMASECSGRGIWMEGASTANGDTVNWDTYDTVMSRSQFCWNGQDGLYVSEFGGNDLHIDHCIVFNNTLSGLRLRGSSAQVSSLHAYDNTQHGVHIENVRTWIANSKIEGNGRHGLYAQSVAANGRFWGGLNVQGCGFRGNSASAANTYDQMIVEADGGDGPWIVNGNRFSGEQNTPRYGLNISSANPNQGNVTGNTFAGTFGTAPIRRDGPTSVQFMNRITANKGIESFEDFLLLTPNGPTVPVPSGMGALWAGVVANRVLPRYEGPAGIETFLQPFLGRSKVGYWAPAGNSNAAASITVIGYTAVTATGTATARNVATTNFFTRMRRLGYVSAATAGSLAGARVAAAQVTRGSGTQFGFVKICRWGISDAALVAGARTFVGVSSSTAAPTNVEPSTLTNVIGMGHGTADTTMRIYFGGTTAQAPIDLGANFPANTTNTDVYELAIFAAPDGTVSWQVTRLNTGAVASGTITPAGANLPTATTLLTYQQAWRSNNATAAAVGIDIMSDYVETDD